MQKSYASAVALLLALPLVACSNDNPEFNPTVDVGADADTTTEDTGTDVETDAIVEGCTFEYCPDELFWECEVDADCSPAEGQDQTCVSNVCVVPPTVNACLAEETVMDLEVVDYCPGDGDDIRLPVLNCFDPEDENYIYAAGEGPATTTLTGVLERFGSGSATHNLCIAAYNEALLLPFLVNHECNSYDVDTEPDEFIACFQLDACRCDELFTDGNDSAQVFVDAAAGASDNAIDSLDSCYTFIGYCDGIGDEAARAACVTRIQAGSLDLMDPAAAAEVAHTETILFAHTRSVPDLEAEVQDLGLYTLTGIPTNAALAFKTSGRESRWRDTWEYGLFVNASYVADGAFDLNLNALGAGAWTTIPLAVGIAGTIPDTHGALAGSIRDCGTGERNPFNIVNATVGISFDAAKLAYFNGNPADNLPQPGRTNTNSLGTYAAIDLPPGPNRVSPIILTEDGLFFAGTRNVFQTPKSVIIATFEGPFLLP